MNEISKSTLKEIKPVITAIYDSLFDPDDKFSELEGFDNVTDYGIVPFNDIENGRKIELTYNDESYELYLYSTIYDNANCLVIHDGKRDGNLFQLVLDESIKPSKGTFFLIHDGTISEKTDFNKNTLIEYIENTAPHLISIVDEEKCIELGNLKKGVGFNSVEFQNFIASFIEYFILRDKFENGVLNIINVKEDFIDWMVADVSGGNYFKNQFDSNRIRFEKEINDYEVIYKENFDSELFILNPTEYKNEIDLRRGNIYKPATSFAEYSINRASGRPKAILGNKNYLRFLEERFTSKETINYWVFQGTPKIYDMVGALKANAVKTWTVSAHKDKIKVGDKFILWLTGNNSGCYALGSISSPVTYRKEEDPEMNFYLKPTEQIDNNRVSIEIEHNYFNSPILLETIKDDEVFKDFKGGNQGTNFTATKEQYETLIDLASSNNEGAYVAVKKVLDQEKLKTFLTILRAFVKSNTINSNDERISFNVRENKRRLVFIIGNRYALCIQKKNSTTEMSFISKDIVSETSENFRNPNGKIEAYWNTFDNLKGYEKNINEGFLIELDRNNKCPHRKYINQDFINDIYSNQTNTIKFIVANITWNSRDWKEVSEDASGHAWVGGENIPHESWNFDFDNPRNKNGNVLGFAKFTNAPKVEGDKNLIIFYSQGKIVGFYGKAEILKKWVDISDKESYNLIGDKNLSVVLKNKIDNIKEKGYLEDKERVGQVGFSYLKKTETALNVLDEAIKLNPAQHQVLTNIKQWILKSSNSQSNSNNGTMESFNKTTALNQILFGPPGTGKTFNTINEALKIVDPLYYAANQKDRKKLTHRFKELLIKNTEENKGQIAFCTFHQSFSYEDFVEGIKPKTTDSKSVYYDTEPGVFKRICQQADSNNSTVKVIKEGKLSWDEEQFKKASFYKLSLGNYQNPIDKPIYEFCRDNGYISIGFGQENDFTGLSETEIKEKCDDLKLEVTAAQQMNFFIHYLKKNNYVIVSNGNKYVRALGKVTGDYEYWEDSPIPYNHFRKVEWIFTDELIPIEEIYERGLSQKTMYKIDESALKQDFFTNQGQQVLLDVIDEKKYVLIIDEINRGNVSSIFGELITLIEKDKRAGCDEELEVTLPYSKEPFKVPNNVYLIGTMNTADRSIEALDTALRRRFSFKEFPPKTYLIKTEGASGMVNGMVEDIDLEDLLITINNRIEKLIDKDHRIGHSYFLKVDNKEKLIHAFKNEIIPLLEEYFFGDYGKIGLVLGNSFVEKINHDFSFADFKAYDNDIQSDLKEKAVFRITDDSLWNFSTI